MFTPHQSMHQFSPQRRQILGTSKRAGQKKAFLGDDEASNIGPQKLFSDLKSTAGKQAEGSKTLKKSPSRALGVKNTQSPQRPQDGSSKPSLGTSKTDLGRTKMQQSPDKKGKLKLTEKADMNLSPTKEQSRPLPPPLLSPQRLEEETSYHTTTTPFPNAPRTPPAESEDARVLSRQSSFVTPATNIGEAGAVRLRKGEILDAMNQMDQMQLEEHNMSMLAEEVEEEEEYPEIEYMPPRVDVPYDFPPQLDDLPKAKELGERMSKMALIGYYKPSTEEKRQEMLSDIFKLRPSRIDAPEMPPQRAEEKDEMWSDMEIRVPLKTNKLASSTGKAAPAAKSHLAASRNASKAPMTTRNPSGSSTAKMNPNTTQKKKALGVRDSNTTMKKTVMNPALRDFENDDMAKIIKAKLRAMDSRESEGFLL